MCVRRPTQCVRYILYIIRPRINIGLEDRARRAEASADHAVFCRAWGVTQGHRAGDPFLAYRVALERRRQEPPSLVRGCGWDRGPHQYTTSPPQAARTHPTPISSVGSLLCSAGCITAAGGAHLAYSP